MYGYNPCEKHLVTTMKTALSPFRILVHSRGINVEDEHSFIFSVVTTVLQNMYVEWKQCSGVFFSSRIPLWNEFQRTSLDVGLVDRCDFRCWLFLSANVYMYNIRKHILVKGNWINLALYYSFWKKAWN